MPGSTWTRKVPSTGARANSASPSAASSSPTASGARMPKRITSFAERPSEKARHDQVGRQEREADLQRAVAEHQLHVERRMKNHANIAAAHSTPTTLAVATLRSAEQPERHQRRAHPRLDHEEQRRAAPPRRRAGRASAPRSSRPRCR